MNFTMFFQCPFFSHERKLFLPNIKHRKANCIVFFSNVFNETNILKLKKLCLFLDKILEVFNLAPG